MEVNFLENVKKFSKYVLIVRMDVDPAKEEEFNKWYNSEHIPALVKVPGVLSAHRYVSKEGTPKYMAIYELSDLNVTKSDAWIKAVDTEWTRKLRPFFKNSSLNSYEMIYPKPSQV